jgi:hypothetical protein
MPAITLSPRPPHHAPVLRVLAAITAAAGSITLFACAPLPPEAAQLAIASSSAVDTLRHEHATLIRAVTSARRAEIESQFEAIYADAEAAVRSRHDLAPEQPLSLEHRLDITAITLSVRDDLHAAIAQTESDLLARAELNHTHARRMTDALSAYLMARTDADQLRASLTSAAATRIGLDPQTLDISAHIDALLDPSR